ACLEQPLRGVYIQRRIGLKIVTPALPNTGLGSEVKDMRPSVEERREIGRPQGLLDEPKSRTADKPGEISLLHRSRVIVREAIDRDDVGAVRQQTFAQVRADEARASCHQRFHANRFLTLAGSRTGRPLRST